MYTVARTDDAVSNNIAAATTIAVAGLAVLAMCRLPGNISPGRLSHRAGSNRSLDGSTVVNPRCTCVLAQHRFLWMPERVDGAARTLRIRRRA